ncbi:hypothetical protein Aca07nite_00070 [Actinoplanes capillaceus]|uniref:Uncharacterized protein n=1 Tax=Actinoplanes campanulatus TaxID=113559 RepID=A0ABQ3W6N8_9ACTN|nr:hypothetical protein [Actinoplanes capillaceus]GID42732.1 hypothetical protein Aca07nite_00070 [Actinoplanes capillaceus]
MTGQSLITAVVVGVAVGTVGRVVACRGRGMPLWLPPAAGVAAAVLATVLSWTADPDQAGPTLLEIGLQLVSALAAVTTVAVTAGPSRAAARWQRSGRGR